MLLASPPSVVVYETCFVIIWGAQFKANPLIQKEMERQTTVLNCQLSLTLIYPMYIYGFTSFTGVYQTIFVIVLPIIKLITKNWISRALEGHNDLKPEAVIFNVEVFNALYISNALQLASTQAATITIMVVDLLHFALTIVCTAGGVRRGGSTNCLLAHHYIVYNLHNRAYYPILESLSPSEFISTLSHVLIYSLLEFASLIVAIVVLKRTLGFSSLRQLSFVLENQAGIIQGKLLIHLIYIMQISLVHIGADFSFKFAWLHASRPSS
ncbi:uncharacterized protein IUM83_04860 [Phytophthora cinnamomi]|uniref:uncharacterized protein n=1 Tax=Phytophthora cinnamomi TaxID=4785 RepID=UPI00355945CF|nr:hypothetical protein IUM83_04860 [Phytophthora cinnamomi]